MSRHEFRLPDVGEGTTEAEIAAWHVQVGDRIGEDTPLVDVMTDKASVEITSPVSGVVLATNGQVGERVAVGSVLVEFEVDGIVGLAITKSASPTSTESSSPSLISELPEVRAPTAITAPLASPSTRRRALELGVALEAIRGTGPDDRITAQDLDHYSRGKSAVQDFKDARDIVHETKIIGLRRKIAEKMEASKRRIPHFTYVEEFDLTELEILRGELNGSRQGDQPKLTLLPFFMRALVRLIPKFPSVNARYDDENGVLRTYECLHIGIATQTQGGLMVPVVRHVEKLTLWDCARELTRVTTAARQGRATPKEMSGSTITVTSLGTLGGISATPIINHPEVAIIGPNKLVERPTIQNHSLAIRTMMNISSSFDHRIVDGYDAARFVQQLKLLIERPALIFLNST